MLLAGAALIVACNLVLDPFGVFGDKVLDWYGYDMAQNPQVAKVAYLAQHQGEYDSYVIGGSKASALSVDLLNDYLDASFYNLAGDREDLRTEGQLIRFLLNNYPVKHLVLAVSPESAVCYGAESGTLQETVHYQVAGTSALAFYGKYLFAGPAWGAEKLAAYRNRGPLTDEGYIAETGCLDRRQEDAAPIGTLADYLAQEHRVIEKSPAQLSALEEALAEIEGLQALCAEQGVDLIVIGLPVSDDEFGSYDQTQLSQFWRGLAHITEFWEFWGRSTVSGDMRYFYDTDHFRSAVGDMVLAYIFGDEDRYVPEDFGHRTTRENVEERIAAAYSGSSPAELSDYTCSVPILMYHSFTDDPSKRNDLTVYVEDLRDQLEALSAAGYQAITYQDLIDYVDHGTPLPENPLLISIDDGYRNNLTLAVPLLEEYGFSATIAVIGCSDGKDTYKDTGEPITPHFALEDAAKYVARGVLDIQTHSYDMHQVTRLDGEDCRQGVLQQEGESDAAYVEALTADFLRSREQIESRLPVTCLVYTYPGGLRSELSERTLQDLGIRVTVTTDYGANQIIKGVPQSLYQLKRIAVGDQESAGALIEQIEGRMALLDQ